MTGSSNSIDRTVNDRASGRLVAAGARQAGYTQPAMVR